MEEFHYRIPWRSPSAHPGHHRSRSPGGGYEFHGHIPLLAAGDPRHLDIRASLSDPFGEYKVRQFLQTSLVPVFAVADLSASMQLAHKPRLLARLCAAIAYSAYRTGDPFGFIGLDSSDRPTLFYPLRRHRGLALELARRLPGHPFQGKGLAACPTLLPWLGERRALIFVISDFHFPLTVWQTLLEHLQPHDVVPVVVWLSQEWRPPTRWGWIRLHDPESGQQQLWWCSPRTASHLQQAFEARRQQLTELCRRYGRPPIFVIDRFLPEAFSRYFLETCA